MEVLLIKWVLWYVNFLVLYLFDINFLNFLYQINCSMDWCHALSWILVSLWDKLSTTVNHLFDLPCFSSVNVVHCSWYLENWVFLNLAVCFATFCSFLLPDVLWIFGTYVLFPSKGSIRSSLGTSYTCCALHKPLSIFGHHQFACQVLSL